jgi:uncharacterized protein (TIGR00296 family)
LKGTNALTFELSQEEGEYLVKLARKALEEYLKNERIITPDKNTPPKLMQRCGVFVTINSIKGGDKELRGCIGYPYPTTLLAQAVIESAINSATQDPRFYSLTPEELDTVVFEVSVLTPPEEVKVKNPKEFVSQIKVGKDGLIIERGACKGLLLPQVPTEWGWNEEEFLCQCCIKAGLPPDNWLLKDTRIYKFQAIIFDEETPGGRIKRKTLSGL